MTMMKFFSDDMRRNPYPTYDLMRGSPVFYDPRSALWIILDYEGVKRTLNDHDAFSSKGLDSEGQTSEWFVFMDPPRHQKLRALVLRAFTPRVVASLEPRIRELSAALLDETIERGEMDLAADFAVPLPMLVIAGMLGIPASDRPLFKRWSEVMVNISAIALGGEEAASAANAFAEVTVEMNTYLKGLIEERKTAPKNDLVTKLIEADVDGARLTENEILGFFQLLIVAGIETTTNLINNALLCLMENPDQLALLRASPDLLPSAIEEVLRYRSPVQAAFRTTKQEVTVHDQVIPAGQLVLSMIGSANRDPQQFRDAGRFDITRDPNPHLALGHGIHFCLGASLARLEGRIALADLLERVKGFELASNEPWKPQKSFHVHGPVRLPIRFEPGSRLR